MKTEEKDLTKPTMSSQQRSLTQDFNHSFFYKNSNFHDYTMICISNCLLIKNRISHDAYQRIGELQSFNAISTKFMKFKAEVDKKTGIDAL